MSDFKVGDYAYYMLALNIYKHGAQKPDYLSVMKAEIVGIPDELGLEVRGYLELHLEDWYMMRELLYKSKQDCIDAFKKRLGEL